MQDATVTVQTQTDLMAFDIEMAQDKTNFLEQKVSAVNGMLDG